MKQGMMPTLTNRVRHDKWKNDFHEIPFEITCCFSRTNHD